MNVASIVKSPIAKGLVGGVIGMVLVLAAAGAVIVSLTLLQDHQDVRAIVRILEANRAAQAQQPK